MRQPKPWYRTSKGAWFAQVARKQHRHSKGPKEDTRKAAFDAFYKLIDQDALHSWVRNAREALQASGHVVIGDEQVGQVLARVTGRPIALCR